MLVTNEPGFFASFRRHRPPQSISAAGYYEDGAFGIRIENVMTVEVRCVTAAVAAVAAAPARV